MSKLNVLKQVLLALGSEMTDNHFVLWNNRSGGLYISHCCDGPDGPGAAVATINRDAKVKIKFTTASHIDSQDVVYDNDYLEPFALETHYDECANGLLQSILKDETNKDFFESWMTEMV
jgi:hypothetical protein